ncbi:uncharacterized protein LOC144904959 [Branchiostoma floridae x Branchiostoma belcheri]
MCSYAYCVCVRARAGYIERKFIFLPDDFAQSSLEEFERAMIQEGRLKVLKFSVADTNEDLLKRLKRNFDFPELQAARVEDIIVGKKSGTGIRVVEEHLLHGWDIRDRFRLHQAVLLFVDRETSDDAASSASSTFYWVMPSPFVSPASTNGSPSQLSPQTPIQPSPEMEQDAEGLTTGDGNTFEPVIPTSPGPDLVPQLFPPATIQPPLQTLPQAPLQTPPQPPLQTSSQPPLQTSSQPPVQTSSQSSQQTSTQPSQQTSTQPSQQTSTQLSLQTSTPSSLQTPSQSSLQTPSQSSEQTSSRSSLQTSTQSSAQSSQQTTTPSSEQTPSQTSSLQTSTQSSEQTPSRSSQQTSTQPSQQTSTQPSQSSLQPVQTPFQQPLQTPSEQTPTQDEDEDTIMS